MNKKPADNELDHMRRIMGALVRMPPKPHDQMKLGKRIGKKKTSPKSKAKKRESA